MREVTKKMLEDDSPDEIARKLAINAGISARNWLWEEKQRKLNPKT